MQNKYTSLLPVPRSFFYQLPGAPLRQAAPSGRLGTMLSGIHPGKARMGGFYGKLQISTPLGSPDPTPALLVKTIGQRGRSDPESKAAQSSARTQRLLKEGPSIRAGHCLATPAAQTPSHPPPATPGLVTWLRHGLGSTEAAGALPAAARERGRAHCSPQSGAFPLIPLPLPRRFQTPVCWQKALRVFNFGGPAGFRELRNN